MDILKRFYMDESTREAVLAYLLDCIKQKAVERVLKRGDTNGIADASDIITEAFIGLKEEFGNNPKPTNTSSR